MLRERQDETPEQRRGRVRAYLSRLIRDGERTGGTVPPVPTPTQTDEVRMATVTASEVFDVPSAARRLGVSVIRVRRALRRRPDIDGRIPRMGGRRLIGADLLPEIADEINAMVLPLASSPAGR